MQAQNSFSEGCTDFGNAWQVPERAHTDRYNELYEAEVIAAPAALPAVTGSAVSAYAVQQAARRATLNKVMKAAA